MKSNLTFKMCCFPRIIQPYGQNVWNNSEQYSKIILDRFPKDVGKIVWNPELFSMANEAFSSKFLTMKKFEIYGKNSEAFSKCFQNWTLGITFVIYLNVSKKFAEKKNHHFLRTYNEI